VNLTKRIQEGLPRDNDKSFKNQLKWFLFGVQVNVYSYGICNGRYARRHNKDGNVQFILWKKGDQKYVDGIGHTKDKWHNFDSSWWNGFEPSYN
jgi:hypothetical protein